MEVGDEIMYKKAANFLMHRAKFSRKKSIKQGRRKLGRWHTKRRKRLIKEKIDQILNSVQPYAGLKDELEKLYKVK